MSPFTRKPVSQHSIYYVNLGFKINMKHLLEKLAYVHFASKYNDLDETQRLR